MQKWLLELQKYLDENTPILVAGNKCDIVSRTVSQEEAEAYARSIGIEHFNTSAKSGKNVVELFTQLGQSKFCEILMSFIHLFILVLEIIKNVATAAPTTTGRRKN